MSLQPLPAPGLPVFTGYQAVRSEHFIMKEQNKHFSRDNMMVSFADNFGNPGQQFLEIDEVQKKNLSFKAGGREVMRIVVERHSLSPTVYRGLGPDGREIWTLQLKTHSFSAAEYILTVNTNYGPTRLPVEKKIMGQKMGILFNGQPVAAMGEQSSMHLRREEHVYVAPGMDILVSLGVAWVHVDKDRQDAKHAEQGASNAAAAVSG